MWVKCFNSHVINEVFKAAFMQWTVVNGLNLCMCLSVSPGGVWGWIANLHQARRHLHSRWGSAQTSQVTNGKFVFFLFYQAALLHQRALISIFNVLSFLSRWRPTCVSSSSRRTTSSRTPKGSGSLTLDTERTTSNPSSTEPSWSDALHLSHSSSSLDHKQLQLQLPLSSTAFQATHIYKLRLGL